MLQVKDKKITKGYHVCESVILTEKEKQPISTYSKVYSCKSEGFKSKNNYTIESINSVIKILNRKFTGVFDRGYDDNKIIDYIDKTKNYFVIRMNDRRTLKGINNLNLLLTIHIGHMNKLVEEMNKKLLSIKIIEASKSIRNKIN